MLPDALPEILPPKSYEEILKELVHRTQELLPGYRPAEGDDVMLVLQSFAYREKLLREHLYYAMKSNFLSTASGAELDHLAETLYGLYRLKGAKPTTTATFTLTTQLAYDVTIPEGYQLAEDGGIYFAYVTEAGMIPAGADEITLPIELDALVASSKVRTEIPVTPIPYLEVHQLGDFLHGGDEESDAEFRSRIRESLAAKSTAGSAQTYRGFALHADERIDDVAVFSPSPGVVKVIYYSPETDSAMQTRVEEAVSAEAVRPLTDQVIVQPAITVPVDVSAHLILARSDDPARRYLDAAAALETLFATPRIGADATVAAIYRALMIPGVLDVQLSQPTANILIDEEHVAVLGTVNLSYEVRDEL